MSETGYWVYRVLERDDDIPMVSEEEGFPEEPTTFDEQLVYRPVTVETNDDGELYAYYYDYDADPMEIMKTGGKRIVPMEQVRKTPPERAIPAHRVEND